MLVAIQALTALGVLAVRWGSGRKARWTWPVALVTEAGWLGTAIYSQLWIMALLSVAMVVLTLNNMRSRNEEV